MNVSKLFNFGSENKNALVVIAVLQVPATVLVALMGWFGLGVSFAFALTNLGDRAGIVRYGEWIAQCRDELKHDRMVVLIVSIATALSLYIAYWIYDVWQLGVFVTIAVAQIWAQVKIYRQAKKLEKLDAEFEELTKLQIVDEDKDFNATQVIVYH